ncbi:protein kinase [Planosporangium thailandense]|uniref:non-specific serine/threonine protein kinase n=1 Tax=Planosporangium thailandense TaxID=765197 RepID=A0ABX0XR91_9ACTN|nr:serine/threonine-protein kinase [Planosporangium thailandense]NJC68519.1 protein kinase [Planosporangium thailandense]
MLSGRYRLDEPIADGGMGEVWRATDVSLGRTVAVKVVRPALLRDPGFDARFRAEARMMASLAHPNVVNVYDYGRSELDAGGKVAYLVMAYVDGEPLSRRIADAGRLPVAETMSVVAQAADALHAAHMHGIVHRDVKPANLLVQPNGTVKLVDFGVARSPAVTQVTTANAILGTAMYMAPEQASGRPVSAATDIYALGAVAYHCLAGRPPFTGEGPLEIALQHVTDAPPPLPADVPPGIQMLVARALAKNPADRYPTAAALAAAARAIRVDAGVARRAATPVTWKVPGETARNAEPGPPTTPDLLALPDATPRAPRRGPRRSVVLAVAGLAAAALIGLAGLGGLLGSQPPAGAGPTERSEQSGAPLAPVGNPSSAGPEPSIRTGSRTAVPVRASAPVSAPTTPPSTAPASGATPTPAPTTSARPRPTGQPSAPATSDAPAPSATATPPANADPTPTGGSTGGSSGGTGSGGASSADTGSSGTSSRGTGSVSTASLHR